jgi:uncharacterized protein (UPF0264 family)
MTKLLVSVRDAAEALVAADAGVDLIDIKEPRRGSLGAAVPDDIREIAAVIAGRAPLSVALGELADWDDSSPSLMRAISQAPAIRFAKLGLAGLGAERDWQTRWRNAWTGLPAGMGRVAVAYADWRRAKAPTPTAILRAAERHDCKAVLVDTFDKHSGTLVDLWPLEQLSRWVRTIQRAGLIAVVAGSLARGTIGAVAALDPDYVAVRGGVCRGGRDGTICPHCICSLRRAIRAASGKCSSMSNT